MFQEDVLQNLSLQVVFKMKGDMGMAQNMKKEETRDHYTGKTHKATWHHPYIFVQYFLAFESIQQRYRDGVI